MKETTENSAPTLPRKVYQPPVIVVLGEMLKGNGATCNVGEGVAVECTPGGSDTAIYCSDGSAADY